MDTIVTPVTVITLDSTRIVHSIKADLVARYFPPVVRLVQYDMSLPVIAVSLMQNGQTYTLPSGAAANIRVHKPDATYVYNPALGCDSTRNIVYFEVTQAMAAASGDGLAIVEIVVDGDIAGTSLITLHFEENPVPEEAIESSDEWETIYELGERIIASTVTPVSTAAGMTDHNVVYLYTGTESGWNQGHMYYYNGTTWVDAGIAVTDTTLSVAGLAADAKKTGDEIADLKDGLLDMYVTDTASGAIASFPDGADNVPVKSLTVDIEPIQSGSGDPSPTNVRPISGHTQATVTRTGNNILSDIIVGSYVNDDGTITSTGNSNFRTNKINIPNGATQISCTLFDNPQNYSGSFGLIVFDSAGNNIHSSNFFIGSGVTEYPWIVTKTIPNTAAYMYIRGYQASGTSAIQSAKIQVEFGQATDYSQRGQTVTIDLDGTRYGGTLDAITGVLTVDRALVSITSVQGKANTSANKEYYFTGVQNAIDATKSIISDKYPYNANPNVIYNTNIKAVGVADNGIILLGLGADGPSDMASANTFLSNNPITVCYFLKTPQTVQLSANEISTVLGQNNIWNDCGDTTVEYRADTKLYINKMLNA